MNNPRTSNWNHDAVFEALVAQGLKPRKTSSKIYVQLYPQATNCAILYKRGGNKFNSRPLHLQPGSGSWIPAEFKRIQSAILSVDLERSVEKLGRQQQWIHCAVDWVRFAQALKLRSPGA